MTAASSAQSTYDELIDQPAETIEAPVRFSDPMAILYTSGTTGVAKGVIVSYEHAYVFAERTAHNLGMTERRRLLLAAAAVPHRRARCSAPICR